MDSKMTKDTFVKLTNYVRSCVENNIYNDSRFERSIIVMAYKLIKINENLCKKYENIYAQNYNMDCFFDKEDKV